MSSETGELQVVSRCAQILRLFNPDRRLIRTAEVTQELGLQRPTAHRYLTSMVREGLLARSAEGSYGIGPLPLQLAAAELGGPQLIDEAEPYMARLSAEAHQTVVLSVWGGLGPVVVKVREDLTTAVTVTVRVGTALPLDAAQSHVFLGLLADRDEVERLLDRLPAGVAEQLRRDAALAANQYLAVNSRFVQGVRALAAPIFGFEGLVATLAFVGTTSALPEDPTSSLAAALRVSARDLSGRLGGANFWEGR